MFKLKNNKYFNYFLYFSLLFFAFLIQTTPLLPQISGVYPNLLLSLLVVISFFENDLIATSFGAIIGLFADIGVTNGEGVHTLSFMVFALITSLVVEMFVQTTTLSAITLSIPIFLLNMFVEIISKNNFRGFFLQISFYIKSYLYSLFFIIMIFIIFKYVIHKNSRRKQPIGIIPLKSIKKLRRIKG